MVDVMILNLFVAIAIASYDLCTVPFPRVLNNKSARVTCLCLFI